MSMYNVYVKTSHGNVRVYQIVALNEQQARNEGSEYGRVTYAMRVCGVAAVR